MRVALTIAKSDPNGKTGIQADLHSFAARGVFGASIISALSTDYPVSPELVRAQIDAVCADFDVNAVKIDAVENAEIIREIATRVRHWKLPNLVINSMPTSGDAADVLQKVLLPRAEIIVLNIAVAARFCGANLQDIEGEELEESAKEMARKIREIGVQHALITGIEYYDSEKDKRSVRDLLFDGEGFKLFSAPRIEGTQTTGKGNALAAAITALLARDYSLVHSVGIAKNYITAAIVQAPQIGKSPYPVQYFPKTNPQP